MWVALAIAILALPDAAFLLANPKMGKQVEPFKGAAVFWHFCVGFIFQVAA